MKLANYKYFQIMSWPDEKSAWLFNGTDRIGDNSIKHSVPSTFIFKKLIYCNNKPIRIPYKFSITDVSAMPVLNITHCTHKDTEQNWEKVCIVCTKYFF